MKPRSFSGLLFITPAATAFSISLYSSSTDPMHFSLRLSSRQIGNGVPQKRERLKFQSLRFSNQLPKRPVPVDSGCQLMVLLSSTIRAFAAVSFINQLSSG